MNLPNDLPTNLKAKLEKPSLKYRLIKYTLILLGILSILTAGTLKAMLWSNENQVTLRSPLQNPIIISKRVDTSDYDKKLKELEALQVEVQKLRK